MARADLAALTPEAVAALTNLGLVKRALREIEQGQGPTLQEDAEGVVSGCFPDGVVARLPPGVPLRDAACSCAASAVCRHRVAVALAYRSWSEAAVPEISPESSPGGATDAELEAALGRRTLERAATQRRRGCDLEVHWATPQRPAEARLPTCSVRFLVPGDLAYARCDCAQGQGCEHVALAVWAFREADARGGTRPTMTVHLAPGSDARGVQDPLAEAAAFARELLLEGVVNVPPSIATRLGSVRAALDAAGLTWPATIVDDLEDALGAYRARSARYAPAWPAGLLLELLARVRAGRQDAELPVRHVLGIGEARETALGHIRLVGLGVRLDGAGQEREAEVFLVEAGTGVVVVLRRHWRYADGETPHDGPALGQRTVATGVRVDALASGQMVTRSALRQANRTLRLGRGAQPPTPQAGDWGELPPGLVVADLERHAAELRSRPPRLLRPRLLAESLHVVPVARVLDAVYAPGDQAVAALVEDPAGHRLRVLRRHRGAAPHALEALAAALGGAPRFLSGHLAAGDHGLELDPLAVVTDRVIALDVAAAPGTMGLPAGRLDLQPTPTSAAIAQAWGCLEDLAHSGLLHPTGGVAERTDRAAQALTGVGLDATGDRLRELAAAQRSAALGPGAHSEAAERAALAWERAGLRLALSREGAWAR